MINSMARSLITAKKYYRSMLAGNDAFNPGAYELISTTILGSNSASTTLDVSAYTSTYKHLQVRCTTRTNRSAADADNIRVRFNSDTSANYNIHFIYGNGTIVGASNESAPTSLILADATAANGATGAFATGVIDISDAFSTSKFKTLKTLHGYAGVGVPEVVLASGLWRSTSAITSMTLFPQLGSQILAGSRFSLYGIK